MLTEVPTELPFPQPCNKGGAPGGPAQTGGQSGVRGVVPPCTRSASYLNILDLDVGMV